MNGGAIDLPLVEVTSLFAQFTQLRRAELRRLKDEQTRNGEKNVRKSVPLHAVLDKGIEQQRHVLKKKGLALENSKNPIEASLTSDGSVHAGCMLGVNHMAAAQSTEARAKNAIECCLTTDGSVRTGCMPGLLHHMAAAQSTQTRLKILEVLECTASEPQLRSDRMMTCFVELGGLKLLSQWLSSESLQSSGLENRPELLEQLWVTMLRVFELMAIPADMAKAEGLTEKCAKLTFRDNAEAQQLSEKLLASWQIQLPQPSLPMPVKMRDDSSPAKESAAATPPRTIVSPVAITPDANDGDITQTVSVLTSIGVQLDKFQKRSGPTEAVRQLPTTFGQSSQRKSALKNASSRSREVKAAEDPDLKDAILHANNILRSRVHQEEDTNEIVQKGESPSVAAVDEDREIEDGCFQCESSMQAPGIAVGQHIGSEEAQDAHIDGEAESSAPEVLDEHQEKMSQSPERREDAHDESKPSDTLNSCDVGLSGENHEAIDVSAHSSEEAKQKEIAVLQLKVHLLQVQSRLASLKAQASASQRRNISSSIGSKRPKANETIDACQTSSSFTKGRHNGHRPAPTSMKFVCGKEFAIAGFVVGLYNIYFGHASILGHKRPVYMRDLKGSKGLGMVFVYYWDRGPGRPGWWIGPEVGGDFACAFSPSMSWLPPVDGWFVVDAALSQANLAARRRDRLLQGAGFREVPIASEA